MESGERFERRKVRIKEKSNLSPFEPFSCNLSGCFGLWQLLTNNTIHLYVSIL